MEETAEKLEDESIIVEDYDGEIYSIEEIGDDAEAIEEVEEELTYEFADDETSEQPADDISWDHYERLNEEVKLKNQRHVAASLFCNSCGLCFNTKSKLAYHEQTFHKMHPPPAPAPETKPQKELFCSPCGLCFNSKTKLAQHQQAYHKMNATTVDADRPFTCDRCGHKFKNKSHMMNHLNVVHLRVKRYQCLHCTFAMYSKTHYTNHMKSHLKIKQVPCPQCGKKFAREETLKVHLRTHSGKHCGAIMLIVFLNYL